MSLTKLLEENKKLRKKIQEYSEIIELIKKTIRRNESIIYKKCPHEWERDYNCAFDDKCNKFCKKCNLWANPYMYQFRG